MDRLQDYTFMPTRKLIICTVLSLFVDRRWITFNQELLVHTYMCFKKVNDTSDIMILMRLN